VRVNVNAQVKERTDQVPDRVDQSELVLLEVFANDFMVVFYVDSGQFFEWREPSY
jgi:hypothetical protein